MKILKTARYEKLSDMITHPPVNDTQTSMWKHFKNKRRKKKIYQVGTPSSPIETRDVDNI